MKVELLTYTENPEKVIAAAAKLCYSSSCISELYNNLDTDKAKQFVEKLSSLGHQSPLEHVSFTFCIEGVSRALLAQITRHRIASYSVQSQRYVKEDNYHFVIPPAIENNPKAKEIYLKSMEESRRVYQQLSDCLISDHQKKYLAEGFSEKEAALKAEKNAIEDARFVLPNACETKMIVTMNARSLLHFFNLRCCNRAQWEIRALANKMLRLVVHVAPTLFKNAGPSCIGKNCPEGKMSCGKQKEIAAFYQELKAQA